MGAITRVPLHVRPKGRAISRRSQCLVFGKMVRIQCGLHGIFLLVTR